MPPRKDLIKNDIALTGLLSTKPCAPPAFWQSHLLLLLTLELRLCRELRMRRLRSGLPRPLRLQALHAG